MKTKAMFRNENLAPPIEYDMDEAVGLALYTSFVDRDTVVGIITDTLTKNPVALKNRISDLVEFAVAEHRGGDASIPDFEDIMEDYLKGMKVGETIGMLTKRETYSIEDVETFDDLMEYSAANHPEYAGIFRGETEPEIRRFMRDFEAFRVKNENGNGPSYYELADDDTGMSMLMDLISSPASGMTEYLTAGDWGCPEVMDLITRRAVIQHEHGVY